MLWAETKSLTNLAFFLFPGTTFVFVVDVVGGDCVGFAFALTFLL